MPRVGGPAVQDTFTRQHRPHNRSYHSLNGQEGTHLQNTGLHLRAKLRKALLEQPDFVASYSLWPDGVRSKGAFRKLVGRHHRAHFSRLGIACRIGRNTVLRCYRNLKHIYYDCAGCQGGPVRSMSEQRRLQVGHQFAKPDAESLQVSATYNPRSITLS